LGVKVVPSLRAVGKTYESFEVYAPTSEESKLRAAGLQIRADHWGDRELLSLRVSSRARDPYPLRRISGPQNLVAIGIPHFVRDFRKKSLRVSVVRSCD
jgi:hypothetical protein